MLAFNMAFLSPVGPDVVKDVLEFLGAAAFVMLLLTLCVTPLRKIGLSWVARFRRMLGLFALFYAVLHGLIYFCVILDFKAIPQELVRRPYVLVGMMSLSILIALGLTSPRSMVRRLGKRWKPLHRLIYVAVILAWLHMFWQSRGGVGEVLAYAVVMGFLLLVRVRVRVVEVLVGIIRTGSCGK
jgi:sulfoxide reductase heme-binding subunit YedZ